MPMTFAIGCLGALVGGTLGFVTARVVLLCSDNDCSTPGCTTCVMNECEYCFGLTGVGAVVGAAAFVAINHMGQP